MGVPAGHAIHVADLYKVSVAGIPACECDCAIRNGEDRAAFGCSVVGREVRAVETEDRMFTAARKSRSNTRIEFQWRSQRGAFERNAFLIVVGVPESKCAVRVPLIDKFGGLDDTVLHEVSIMKIFVDDHADMVAGLDLCVEVDFPLENL